MKRAVQVYWPVHEDLPKLPAGMTYENVIPRSLQQQVILIVAGDAFPEWKVGQEPFMATIELLHYYAQTGGSFEQFVMNRTFPSSLSWKERLRRDLGGR